VQHLDNCSCVILPSTIHGGRLPVVQAARAVLLKAPLSPLGNCSCIALPSGIHGGRLRVVRLDVASATTETSLTQTPIKERAIRKGSLFLCLKFSLQPTVIGPEAGSWPNQKVYALQYTTILD
jgi:hypothetical protein